MIVAVEDLVGGMSASEVIAYIVASVGFVGALIAGLATRKGRDIESWDKLVGRLESQCVTLSNDLESAHSRVYDLTTKLEEAESALENQRMELLRHQEIIRSQSDQIDMQAARLRQLGYAPELPESGR